MTFWKNLENPENRRMRGKEKKIGPLHFRDIIVMAIAD